MRVKFLVLAAMVAALPSIALADDPNDPTMRDPAARARDRAIIRQLNLNELAAVRERDAGYAEGWRAWQAWHDGEGRSGDGEDYSRRVQVHQREMDQYARDRASYERRMAQWRRAVAACRAGDWSACDN